MTFALVVVFVLYGLLVLSLYIGWLKAIGKRSSAAEYHSISIVVPVRNEEFTIGRLATDLVNKNYPSDKFEIIFVDDHSEDSTALAIQDAVKSVSNARLIKSARKGKKAAITTGVQEAQGQIIVTTDADCRVSTDWLASINMCFENDSVKMLMGGVKIEANKFLFSKMQSIEFSSLIGSGAATLAFGVPTMCNGANLAFRKEVFIEVDGYKGNEAIASGDDEFLLRKVAKRYPNGIRFNNLVESIVSTGPAKSITQFAAQRLRWAGKWKHHRDLSTKFLGLFIFTVQFSVILVPFVYYLNLASGDMLLTLLFSKAVLEYIFIHRVTRWLGVQWDWPSFILLQVLYPVYAIVIGFGSLFVSPVWKGRK